jgi:hypothetical protein
VLVPLVVGSGLALAWRHQPHIHKRLIWLATIELLGAGFGRLVVQVAILAAHCAEADRSIDA